MFSDADHAVELTPALPRAAVKAARLVGKHDVIHHRAHPAVPVVVRDAERSLPRRRRNPRVAQRAPPRLAGIVAQRLGGDSTERGIL
ncbi:hypothetical protein [Sphingopyxis soli]|uniref:hypothetical protein n=1 Tax=Sphingopyxis soli TaxID=592051 RepID=UPI001BFDFF8F|nr:hypothetical protein [Sphingopyxis soli]